MHFVIKLFPEIFVKSQAVRRHQIEAVRKNLVRALRSRLSGLKFEVRSDWEKLELRVEESDSQLQSKIQDVLASLPGIEKFSEIVAFQFSDLDEICEKAGGFFAPRVDGKNIAVRVKRSGNHQFKSTDLERKLGGWLLANTGAKGVDLKTPEALIELEIRKDRCFILGKTWKGMGGYPAGTQGKALCLLSGGYDSALASLHCLRRGQIAHYVFFNLGGRQQEVAVRRMAWSLWSRFGSDIAANFYSVPFDEVTDEIGRQVPGQYGTLVLKRQMMRAASRIASRAGIHALVTGEAVGQVSTQTLVNLRMVDDCADRLVFRPLIYMDKGEIIRQARQARLAELAEASPEYCGLTGRKPTASGKVRELLQIEQALDPSVLDRAIKRQCKVPLKDLPASLDLLPVDMVQRPSATDVVIDVRHPDEIDSRPLILEGFEVRTIPFFEVQKRLPDEPGDSRFLLYCERGIMSRLHAELLLEKGFERVGVYKP